MDPVAIAAFAGLGLVAVVGVTIAVVVLRRATARIENPLPVVVDRDGKRVVEVPTRQTSRTSRAMPLLAVGRWAGTGLLRIVPGGVRIRTFRETFLPFPEIAEVDTSGFRSDYVVLVPVRGRGYGMITASPQGADAVLQELAPYCPFTLRARERLTRIRPAG